MTQTLSSTLDASFATKPPSLLFHYTSATGLIGILRSREAWASNVAFLNDIKEVDHAVEYARLAIDNAFGVGRIGPVFVDTRDMALLEDMRLYVGSAAKRYYIFSLSEERDLLSQWRAYCPPGGGYSIGFPTKQLGLMANEQGFTLAPCIYDENVQYRIVSEFVSAFLLKYRASLASGGTREEDIRKQICWEFGQHVTRFGIALKHRAFREEKEWRLISPMIQEPHAQLDYSPTSTRVVPFYRFRLADEHHPKLAKIDGDDLTVIVGPTSDSTASQMAVQFFLTSTVGGAAHGNSEIPYRTW